METAENMSKGGTAGQDASPRAKSPTKPGTYPNQLGQIRRARKKSQVQIAEHLGVTNKAVSSWECGTRELRAGVIVQLCDYLECTPGELLGYDKESTLPRFDAYEEHIHTVFFDLTTEGKATVCKIADSISLNPEYSLHKKRRSLRGNRLK